MEPIVVNPDPFAYMIRDWLMQIPSLLVCLGGCILTLKFRKRLQAGALPAFSGFALLLVLSLTSPVIWQLLPPKIYEINAELMEPITIILILGTVQNFLWALGMLLLGLGIFLGRARPTPDFLDSSAS